MVQKCLKINDDYMGSLIIVYHTKGSFTINDSDDTFPAQKRYVDERYVYYRCYLFRIFLNRRQI